MIKNKSTELKLKMKYSHSGDKDSVDLAVERNKTI